MARMHMSYTISEEEYEEELLRLLKSAESYLDSFSDMTRTAASLIGSDNHEGCVKAVAQMRDSLASADYRLHDVMNVLLQFLKSKEDKIIAKQQASEQNQPAQTTLPNPTSSEKTQLKDRMQEVKQNIKNLGLQIPEEQLQDIMRKANDKAS